MKNLKKGIFYFLAGAVIGAVPAWLLAKKKYERIANNAIAEVKETYAKRREQDILAEKARTKPPLEELVKKVHEEVDTDTDESDLEEMKEIIETNGYAEDGTYNGYERPTLEERLDATPYVISPEMFGEVYGPGNTHTMTYYSNGVLVDDASGMVEDIEAMIGMDALNHFGDYERDIVHVRNDRYMMDIEVCLDSGTYEDVGGINEKPYNPEDDFDEVDE